MSAVGERGQLSLPRDRHAELFQCWHTVFDGGPTLQQHWVNAPCLLGSVKTAPRQTQDVDTVPA